MSVYIFDTETTDKVEDDKPLPDIIEAAWLRLRADEGLLGPEPDRIPARLEVFESFCDRFMPSQRISFGAMSVHHILPHELEGCAPSSAFALPPDVEYLIGHSIDFDFKATGSPENVKRICTCAMARHVWQDADSYSLSALLYQLLGPTNETRELLQGAHGAATDVRNTLRLLELLLQAKPDITTWSALYTFSEDSRIPLRMPITKARGELLTDIDDGLILWCLRQDWLEKYLRIGLQREWARRNPPPEPRIAPASAATVSTQEDDDDNPF